MEAEQYTSDAGEWLGRDALSSMLRQSTRHTRQRDSRDSVGAI